MRIEITQQLQRTVVIELPDDATTEQVAEAALAAADSREMLAAPLEPSDLFAADATTGEGLWDGSY